MSSNRSAIPTAVTPSEAWSLLGQIRAVRGHVFLADDVELVVGDAYVPPARLVTHRLVTGAHLLALARRHGARFATFDKGVVALAGPDADDVVLIPSSMS